MAQRREQEIKKSSRQGKFLTERKKEGRRKRDLAVKWNVHLPFSLLVEKNSIKNELSTFEFWKRPKVRESERREKRRKSRLNGRKSNDSQNQA